MAAMTRRPTMLLLLLLALLFCVALSQRNHEEYGGPVIHPPGFKNIPGMEGVQSKWPDVRGMDGIAATSVIKASRPDLRIVTLVQEGAMVTRDMRFDRVRVYVDQEGKVVGVPRVG